MRLRPFVASSIIALVVIASHKAEASAILFTDRVAFNAAVNDATLFGSFPDPFCRPVSIFVSLCTVTFLPVEVSSFENIFQGGDLLTFVGDSPQVHFRIFRSVGDQVLIPVDAFGFDLVSIDSPLRLTFASFGGLEGSISLFEPSFVGVLLLNDTFNGFQFWPSSSTSVVQIDNVAVRAVPEPSSLMLVGAGVTLLIWRRPRRFTGLVS
jgi:hypothetical protein